MRVVDASAIVDLVARTPRGARVRRSLTGQDLAAPELLDAEVLSALARLTRAGVISGEHADQAVGRLGLLRIDRITHEHLTARAWNLRDRVRIADSFYVACAEMRRCPVVTCDGPLSRASLPGVTIIHVS